MDYNPRKMVLIFTTLFFHLSPPYMLSIFMLLCIFVLLIVISNQCIYFDAQCVPTFLIFHPCKANADVLKASILLFDVYEKTLK